MNTTTIADFWEGFQTTTEEIIQANWNLFYMIIASLFVCACLTLIAKGLLYFFKK